MPRVPNAPQKRPCVMLTVDITYDNYRKKSKKYRDEYQALRGGGCVDACCFLCLDRCTDHSTCSNRYMLLQGAFKPNTSVIDILSVCDHCVFEFMDLDLDHKYYVMFKCGKCFNVDAMHREND
jgi:hypothetical protein